VYPLDIPMVGNGGPGERRPRLVFAESLSCLKSSALRPYAARATFGGGNQFQEVDTFNRLLLVVHGPDTNGANRNSETRVASTAGISVAEGCWLTLIAALVAWGVSSGARPAGGLTSSSPGCLFVGKGGLICNGATTAAQKVAVENADPCLSLGKGARYCPPSKQDDAPSTRPD
jgi:hypothetical protein